MKRSWIPWIAGLGLAMALGCGRDEAAQTSQESAKTAAEAAQQAADEAADVAAGDVSGGPSSDAIATCRRLAENGAWDQALDACKRAHELLPDDLAIEHAYQQAQAAAKP